jgi:hypothetical protein
METRLWLNMRVLDEEAVRQSIAMYLFGENFTVDNVKSVAIIDHENWYKYPLKGKYRISNNTVLVKQEGGDEISVTIRILRPERYKP